MICPSCKGMVEEDNAFCHLCGARLMDPPQNRSPSGHGLDTTGGVAEQAQGRRPAPRPAGTSASSRYSGVSLVAGTLSFIGWMIAIAGVILGAYLASEYKPEYGEENAEAMRLGMFVGSALAGWLYAIVILWMGYVLRLLSDIERNTVGGRSSDR